MVRETDTNLSAGREEGAGLHGVLTFTKEAQDPQGEIKNTRGAQDTLNTGAGTVYMQGFILHSGVSCLLSKSFIQNSCFLHW